MGSGDFGEWRYGQPGFFAASEPSGRKMEMESSLKVGASHKRVDSRGDRKKWVTLHGLEASYAQARQESHGVVDEPSPETREKESHIDLKKKMTLPFQTFKPDHFF